jgi:hypothetical protein
MLQIKIISLLKQMHAHTCKSYYRYHQIFYAAARYTKEYTLLPLIALGAYTIWFRVF